MALQSSGAISLNDIHVEVGGTSGTTCSLNDSDIRALLGKSSGATSSFSEFYGASSVSYSAFATWAAANYPSVKHGSYQTGSGRVQASCTGSMWGSPLYGDTTDDSDTRAWSRQSIQYSSNANNIANNSRYVVWARTSYRGYGAVTGANINSCQSYSYDPWSGYANDCWYHDDYLNAYRKMTFSRSSYANFTGP